MAGKSVTGDMVRTGKMFMAQSNANQRTGPSNKNLGPSRVARPNPAPMVRQVAGRSIRGPDKGAGGR